MLLLVNYDPHEKAHLNSLDYTLKGLAHEGMTTGHTYGISSIVAVAKSQGCKAILCANTETLKNLTGDPKATLDKWRGTRFNFAIPVIVINSLTHFFNVPHGEWLLQKDLAKLKTAMLRQLHLLTLY